MLSSCDSDTVLELFTHCGTAGAESGARAPSSADRFMPFQHGQVSVASGGGGGGSVGGGGAGGSCCSRQSRVQRWWRWRVTFSPGSPSPWPRCAATASSLISISLPLPSFSTWHIQNLRHTFFL